MQFRSRLCQLSNFKKELLTPGKNAPSILLLIDVIIIIINVIHLSAYIRYLDVMAGDGVALSASLQWCFSL